MGYYKQIFESYITTYIYIYLNQDSNKEKTRQRNLRIVKDQADKR